MIISDKVKELLNYRISQEEASSRLYKSMSIWLSYNGFSGAEKRWGIYSDEEQKHAEWAYGYLLDLDVKPEVPALEAPPCEFDGLVDIIQKSYDHEIKVTEQCKALASAAMKEGDFLLLELAQKYNGEQIEELAKTQYWLDRLEAFGDSEIALRHLDEEMGEN